VIHKLIEWAAEYIKGDKTFADIFGTYPYDNKVQESGLGPGCDEGVKITSELIE